MNNHQKRLLITTIAGSLLCSWAAPSLAVTADPLQGLWVGTDPSDGGLQTWSIAATNKNGVYQVRGNDTYLRLCTGNRGSVLGRGVLNPSGNLIADLKIQCFADPTNETYMPPVAVTLIFKIHQTGYLSVGTADSTLLPTTIFKSGSASDTIEGVWSGTDPNDGGLQTWIIARKGTAYQVRVNDTYLRTCAGNRGSFLGKGLPDQEGNLNAEMKIQCLADPTNEPYLKPVILNFSFKWNAHGYLEAATTSGVTQQATTLFKIADKTVFK